MFDLLEQLVITQSHTRNKKGVDRVGKLIRLALKDLPLDVERFPQEEFGDHLLFKSLACAEGSPYILLCGHMDTIFPPDTEFNWYMEDAEKAYGPGVIDMKGGLVVFITAIQRLGARGLLSDIPLALFCSSDEELGSPSSIPVLKQLAPDLSCALVGECGGADGQVVTGRRGKRGFHLEVHGQGGHAAFAEKAKASAVLELARKTIGLEALNDPEIGNVVNVGRVEGGIGMNSIAESATALIDSRFTTASRGDILFKRIKQLVGEQETPGTSCRISVTNERPVMLPSEAGNTLFGISREQGKELGMDIQEESREGVSDANSISGEGVPVLDGLGPIGGFDHSDREYMIKASLGQRVDLVERILLQLHKKGLPC